MELLDKLNHNTELVFTQIEAFSESGFNAKPSEKEWSAAEVIEHLFRSEFGIPKLFRGPSELPDRAPDLFVSKMEQGLLNLTKKVQAPDTIKPTSGPKSKPQLFSKFKENRNRITEAYLSTSPNEICSLFDHPFYGPLTRLEWIYFCIFHTQRHLHQLKAISNSLS